MATTRRYEEALKRNEAHETRVKSREVVELEEWDDEGPTYAFHLEGGSIFFVSSQEIDSSAKFPNSDFSLVRIYSEDKFLVEEIVEKRGETLDPKRRIPPASQGKWNFPQHMQVIEGTLEQLEMTLSGQSAQKLR